MMAFPADQIREVRTKYRQLIDHLVESHQVALHDLKTKEKEEINDNILVYEVIDWLLLNNFFVPDF